MTAHAPFYLLGNQVAEKFLAEQAKGTHFFRGNPEVDFREVYLNAFETAHGPEDRQEHDCRCCLEFLKQVGSLVYVAEDGTLRSALWDETEVDDYFKPVIAALRAAAENNTIARPFVSAHEAYGEIEKGGWNHFYLKNVKKWFHGNYTAYEWSAKLVEDYRILTSTFDRFREEHVDKAIELLAYGKLERNEALVKHANWLKGVFQIKNNFKGRERTNLLWHVVVTAPYGYTHYHSTLFGLILEDIIEGVPFETIRRRHANLAKSEVYQRPTSKPSEALIQQAEKIVGAIGIAESLQRRYATVDDVLKYNPPVWLQPVEEVKEDSAGVFKHLLPNAKQAKVKEHIKMGATSWYYFSKEVLPHAKSFSVQAPSRAGYVSFVTAQDESAKPIIKWDREDARNPISWYTLVGGASAQDFGLMAGYFTNVNSIIRNPMNEEGLFLLLDGCAHTGERGLGLFPEIMRAELYDVRKVIENFSNEGVLGVVEGKRAGGMFIGDGINGLLIRVDDGTAIKEYNISSWK